jgi:hypothetical protein
MACDDWPPLHFHGCLMGRTCSSFGAGGLGLQFTLKGSRLSIDRLDRHKHPLAQFVVSPILKLPTFVCWLYSDRVVE